MLVVTDFCSSPHSLLLFVCALLQPADPGRDYLLVSNEGAALLLYVRL